MKLIKNIIFAVSPLIMPFQPVMADVATDFECLMDVAERKFQGMTPVNTPTNTINISGSDFSQDFVGSWRYRSYQNGFFVGLKNDADLYVFYNNTLFPQGHYSGWLNLLAPDRCSGGELDQELSLTLLHINDHHSHLEADSGANLDFNGVSTRVQLGGFPRVAAQFKAIKSSFKNVVNIHAGDAVTGTLFYTLFKGEADAALMNDVCFDIFALGNHEFDGGDAGLKTFLDYLALGQCGTEVLAANVVPAVGTPLAPNDVNDYIEPFTVKSINGQQVGFIGLDIASKTKNSSSPLETTQFLDETTTAQQYIDQLTAQGVNKIVLVTHYQYRNDLEMAANLRGVDVIVGGDSHTLLGDFSQFGLNSGGDYPTKTTDAEGNPVCIVQAWQYAAVVGELHVDFDKNGKVKNCMGTPHLLLGDSFKRRPPEGGDRVELGGSEREEILSIINASPEVSIVTPDSNSQAILDEYAAETEVLQNTEIGQVQSDLCLERIPGQGRSAICDVSQTAANGGDIQQLVAEAFRARSFEADICIQNAGGVRIDIPEGPLSIGDAYELLPFANTLVNMQLTGEQIRQTLEEAADFAIDPDGSTGAFPYAAGLRWHADMSKPLGQRFSQLEVKRKNATSFEALDLNATYTVVVNSFIASGGDKYETLEAVSEDSSKVVDTFIDYANAFVDYIQINQNGVLNKLPLEDYSTQSFINTDGVQQ